MLSFANLFTDILARITHEKGNPTSQENMIRSCDKVKKKQKKKTTPPHFETQRILKRIELSIFKKKKRQVNDNGLQSTIRTS